MTPTSCPAEPPATGLVEPADSAATTRKLQDLESLVRAIEEELADESIDDGTRARNIGERVAGYLDGR
ncbi:MAG: hypothetical protein ACYTJ0_04820 [Planctomycetota bacterium]|jgi:hypothetical protein